MAADPLCHLNSIPLSLLSSEPGAESPPNVNMGSSIVTVVELTVEAIDAAKDTVSITYSGGAGNPPSEADILAAWEPVLVSANGSVCILVPAPQLYNDEATPAAIYPAVAIA